MSIRQTYTVKVPGIMTRVWVRELCEIWETEEEEYRDVKNYKTIKCQAAGVCVCVCLCTKQQSSINNIQSPESTSLLSTNLSMLLIWLCRARKDTGDSMASRLLAHSLTTFSPVLSIFSVNWSTAMLLGAHTRTGLQMYTQTHHRKSYDRNSYEKPCWNNNF